MLCSFVIVWLSVGHDEVPLASVSNRVFVRSHSYTGSFSCKSNSFSYERFCTKPRFQTEAQGNPEMAYRGYRSPLNYQEDFCYPFTQNFGLQELFSCIAKSFLDLILTWRPCRYRCRFWCRGWDRFGCRHFEGKQNAT